jgi:hypothetical protein
MGPYVVTVLPGSDNTVALSHVHNPAPPKQPQSFISSISCLRIFDDLHAIELYIFRPIVFNNLPIDCILDKRLLRILQDSDNLKDVRNFEYSVRWKVDSSGLSFPENPSWCMYQTIAHTFALDTDYRFNHRSLNSHGAGAFAPLPRPHPAPAKGFWLRYSTNKHGVSRATHAAGANPTTLARRHALQRFVRRTPMRAFSLYNITPFADNFWGDL